MKKKAAMLMFVLAASMFATAQSEQTGAANGPMTMTGCISEKDGKYMMMNKAHPEGVQLMGSGMKSHVGHKMQVSGTMKKGDKGDMMVKVKKMKMMSEKCDASE